MGLPVPSQSLSGYGTANRRFDGLAAVIIERVTASCSKRTGAKYAGPRQPLNLTTVVTRTRPGSTRTAATNRKCRSSVSMIASVEKVKRLFAHVTASSEQHSGQLLLLGCAGQPDVAAALERTTTRRIGYVSRLLRETGLTPAVADLRATLAYAAYLGHAQLALTTPGALPRTSQDRKELIDELATVLLG
ncbi:MAG TPA: hypothetical protein VE196_02540 [Pseudonocardiaceae bacterium]|jgi:hypothetical protein|nr:hypothetical protein [Pseudonocardiaceae bacterium]